MLPTALVRDSSLLCSSAIRANKSCRSSLTNHCHRLCVLHIPLSRNVARRILDSRSPLPLDGPGVRPPHIHLMPHCGSFPGQAFAKRSGAAFAEKRSRTVQVLALEPCLHKARALCFCSRAGPGHSAFAAA